MIKANNYIKKLPEYLENYNESRSGLKSFEKDRIQRVRSLSYFLDNSIKLPVVNYRIGFDSIIGIVPVFGDAVSAGLSLYILYQAHKLNVSKRDKLKMIYNIGVESLIGTIPIAGDIFDAAWKANARNCRILEKHLGKTEKGENVI